MKPFATPSPTMRAQRGFTLLELAVTMIVFAIFAGAAIVLVNRHVALFTTQQGQANLNITMRQAIAQLQSDVINAGAGYFNNVNPPGSPIGLTILNGQGVNCDGTTSNSNAIDTFNIIAFNNGTASTPLVPATPTATFDLSATNTATLTTTDASVSNATLAASYVKGSELLFVKNATDMPSFMTVTLTANASVSGGNIAIQFTPVQAISGTSSYQNPGDSLSSSSTYLPSYLTTYANSFTTLASFANGDYVLLLSPITYSVDASNNLIRIQNGACAVVASGILSFKVGAQTHNSSGLADNPQYYYQPSYYNNDYTQLRGARITLIGRTAVDPSSNFVNSFDGGHYRIEALSTVVSPRNLSMNDQ